MRRSEQISSRAKEIRAEVIQQYMAENDYKACVCFSCGNASRKLREAGVECIDISPTGDLQANRWWTMAEIKRAFPACFDATSGHLPAEVMLRIAERFMEVFGHKFHPGQEYVIPTGSGETIICLKLAFPLSEFIALYDNRSPATQHSPQAPLSGFVAAFFKTHLIG